MKTDLQKDALKFCMKNLCFVFRCNSSLICYPAKDSLSTVI